MEIIEKTPADEQTHPMSDASKVALALKDVSRSIGLARKALIAAETIADKSEKAWARCNALEALALGLARAGAYEEAIRTAEDADAGTGAWIGIGIALFDSGNEKGASELLSRAIDLATRPNDAESKAGAFARVANALARVEQRQMASAAAYRALAIAESVELELPRARATLTAAQALARTGEGAVAADMAERVLSQGQYFAAEYSKETPNGIVLGLGHVAAIFAFAGRSDRAVEVAEASGDREYRGWSTNSTRRVPDRYVTRRLCHADRLY